MKPTPLREVRKRRNLRIEDLAVAAGVSARQIQRIETGQCVPLRATQAAIAAALGVKVSALFPLKRAS